MRTYYPTPEEDITINFIPEGDFATHYTSLEAPRPSHFNFQALEPGLAITFSYEYVQQLCQRRPETERLLRLLLEREYSRLMTHTECLLQRHAEERYRIFLETHGQLLSRISVGGSPELRLPPAPPTRRPYSIRNRGAPHPLPYSLPLALSRTHHRA